MAEEAEDQTPADAGAYGTRHYTEEAMKAEGTGVFAIDRIALETLVERGKAKSIEEAAELVDSQMQKLHEARQNRAKRKVETKPARAPKSKAKKAKDEKADENEEPQS